MHQLFTASLIPLLQLSFSQVTARMRRSMNALRGLSRCFFLYFLLTAFLFEFISCINVYFDGTSQTRLAMSPFDGRPIAFKTLSLAF